MIFNDLKMRSSKSNHPSIKARNHQYAIIDSETALLRIESNYGVFDSKIDITTLSLIEKHVTRLYILPNAKNIPYVMAGVVDEKGYRKIMLPKYIMGVEKGSKEVVDHKDGDTLNNCISNLRTAKHGDNIRNTKLTRKNSTGYKGVRKNPKGWYNVSIHVGEYETLEEARAAFKEKFSLLFPDSIIED